MATAVVSQSRMERVKASTLNWLEWKEAGKAPKSREAALRIVSDHIGLDFSKARASVARTMPSNIDDRLSYVVWDIQVNDCQLNYNRSIDAILSDLLAQAADCIFRYTRAKVSTKRILEAQNSAVLNLAGKEAPESTHSNKTSIPTVISRPGTGAQTVSSLTKDQLDEVAAAFVEYAVRMLLRWKAMGADREYYKRVLRRVEEKLLSEL